ncbi:PAS domain S-box-containing protein/diguanylate cyclase (GGDEF) domain-containing protein [Duganella sp. CF517]|nr:PAS domain S-box-containing protein/diguanylate cyclase (GGDEF) domain-containing protein [Duganella sp. CF517]
MFCLMVQEIKECAIFLMDTRGVITSWNRAAEVMKGYRADEAIGQHLSLLYRDEDRVRRWADHNLGQAAEHGFYSEETWRRRKDGSLFWAHIALTGLRDEHDRLIGFSKVTMDLTRHKLLEQCLDEKEENRRIMTAANAGTWKWQAAGRHLALSPALKQLLGYEAGGAAPDASDWRALVDPRDVPAVCARLRTMMTAMPARPLALELRLCRQDGNCRWFFVRADWTRDAAGQGELSGVCVDIHDMRLLAEDRERLLNELQLMRLRFRAVIDQMPSGVFVAEVPSGKLLYQNLKARRIFGATLDEIATYHDYVRVDIRDLDGRRLLAHEFPLAQAILSGRPVPARELVFHPPGAAPRYFRVGATPVQADGDERRMAVAVAHDIDDLKRAQESLRAEKERAEVTLRAISNGVVTTGLDGRIDSMNTAAERLTGWSQREALGRPLDEVLQLDEEPADEPGGQPRAPAAGIDPVLRCLRENRPVTSSAPAVLHARGGGRHMIDYAAAPLQLPDNRTGGAVLVLNDVTESRGLLKHLGYQASHDVLTGLVNRREFGVRLQRALDRTGQPGASNSALLYLDLDQFKIVNDTCGHAAGDDLLRQLSVAYGAHVRERDTLARIGGDEFALIVEHCTVEEAKVVADKLLETTRNFRYICNNQVFRLGVSIGLTPLDGGTTTMEEALRQADHACYIAKEGGRNRVFLQQRGGAEIAQRRNDMYWVKRLGDAFRNDELQLYHQPIRALGGAGDGGLHYEILLRMKDGSAGPVGPTSFLPAAERYDIMQEVDRWVLDRSLAWLEAHPGHVERLELCTINLSQRALADPGFQQYAAARIQAVAVPAHKLCFEITETGAFANMQNTLSFVLALQRLGCRFALDDFGTGMASFAYLKQLPVNYVKIDGSFIQMMTSSTVDFEMVRFTNDISHIMGRRTIAEFVNDEDTLAKLTEIGVDYAQGFMLGEPQPLEA